MSLREWHTHSFLIELKPRTDFASLFIDCPLDDGENVEDEISASGSSVSDVRYAEFVKVSEHILELRDVDDCNGELTPVRSRFYARLADLYLHPNTVCSLVWADHRRLFMCKVRAEADRLPLESKTFHRLAKEISSTVLLDEYTENARCSCISLECANCSLMLFACDAGQMELHAFPEDDWLDTSPSMEYFCRDSCGHSHVNAAHPSDVFTSTDTEQWMPTRNRFFVAHSFVVLLKETLHSNAVQIDDVAGVVKCAQCGVELGISYRKNTDVVKLHHSVTTLKASSINKPYIDDRFGCLERYFAWLLLSQCESQASLKLVIRSYDRRPYLLIWLLESYVVLTSGELVEGVYVDGNEATDNVAVRSFPALKMLYKVFDGESARSDPRANGEDTSVGLLDVPLGCCIRLIELLLSSSHSFPPACRAVGQFYVGFLKLNDSLE
uniref:E3 ubiquitin-protein ligase E3D n=1 Tax=Parascaris univalens TaxID=6257 RepID=A0A915AFL5_PARUN